MRIIFYLTSTIILLSYSVQGQSLSREFGRITQADVDYKRDDGASAVVLFDLGDTRFMDSDMGFNIQFTRIRRIKIIKNEGVEYAEVSIPYYVDGYGKTESVKAIEAFSINIVDGAMIKTRLDPQTIYTERINDNWYVKKFAFPQVKEGSILEYISTQVSPFLFNLPDWEYQSSIPTIYSEYKVRMTPFYEYVFLLQGARAFSDQESEVDSRDRYFGGINYNEYVHKYIMTDVPAFEDESFITSKSDYIIKIDFQLARINRPNGVKTDIITTWDKLISEMIKKEYFGKYEKRAEKLVSEVISAEVLAMPNSIEKAKEIIDEVKIKFSWNGYNDKYATSRPKQLLTTRSGNSAELNLLMGGVLRSQGFDVTPVLLSTRNHGKVRKNYPFYHYFNYVVMLVDVDGQQFMADATAIGLSFDRLPKRAINGEGLIIKEGSVNWIGLQNSVHSLNNMTFDLKIDPTNSLALGTISGQSTEYEAYDLKRIYKNDSSKLAEYLLSKGAERIIRLKTKDLNDKGGPYILGGEVEAKVENIAGSLIISPFLKFPIQTNRLTQKKRSYPVDMVYSFTNSFNTTLNIPEGYQLEEVPEDYELDNSLASITIHYTVNQDNVKINGSYSFKKSRYGPNEYARIKSYMGEIVKRFNQPILMSASTE